MNEEERWNLVKGKSALDFFNEVMELVTVLQSYDIVVIIASARWLRLAEALLNSEVIFLELGASPITEDRSLDLEEFADVLDSILSKRVEKGKERM